MAILGRNKLDASFPGGVIRCIEGSETTPADLVSHPPLKPRAYAILSVQGRS